MIAHFGSAQCTVLTSKRTNTISMTKDQYLTVRSDDDEDNDDYVNNSINSSC
jgi:hypothetical protein